MKIFSLGLILFVLAAVGCGGGTSTTPSEMPETPSGKRPPAELPGRLWGAFTASDDVPEMAANAGNVVLVVPSYADDANVVAAALRANGKIAILSAHHVFGNPEATWEQGWAQTKAWAEPLEELVAAVYVVDEPLSQGISAATRDRAIARVKAEGYRTVVGEGVDVAVRSPRAPADLLWRDLLHVAWAWILEHGPLRGSLSHTLGVELDHRAGVRHLHRRAQRGHSVSNRSMGRDWETENRRSVLGSKMARTGRNS